MLEAQPLVNVKVFVYSFCKIMFTADLNWIFLAILMIKLFCMQTEIQMSLATVTLSFPMFQRPFVALY